MKKLKDKRIEKNLTLKQLAELVGTTYQAISHYETGRRFPKKEILCKLAEVLGCYIDDLI